MKEVLLIMQQVIIKAMDVLGTLLGGWDGFLYTLIFFVVMKYFTSGIASIANKKLSKEFCFKGIARTISVFVLISMGNMIDMYVISNGNPIRTVVCFFYISEEGVSILKNMEMIGLPIPKKLKGVLECLKNNDN